MTNLTFNDRASYLVFRKEWKVRYAELTLEIRETREAIKVAYREGQDSRASTLQYRKACLRRDAHSFMNTLTEAKQEAQRQYEAERQKVTV